MADAQIEEHESRCERHPPAGFSEGRNAHPEKSILQHLEEISQSIHGNSDRGCHFRVVDETAGFNGGSLYETAESPHIPDDTLLSNLVLDIEVCPGCEGFSPALPAFRKEPWQASEQQTIFEGSRGEPGLCRKAHRQKFTWPAFGLHDGSQSVGNAAAGKQVRAAPPKLPGGAPGEKEAPLTSAFVVKELYIVKQRRHFLDFIDNDSPDLRPCLQFTKQETGVRFKPPPQPAILQVNQVRLFVFHQMMQECGLASLPRPE
ncbi:MAG: hypothetical protein ABSG85_13110 [Spirochaetia bacterium]